MKKKTDVLSFVDSAKNGNRKSFEKLVLLFQKDVCYYINSLISKQSVAVELTQETFIRAYNALKTIKNPNQFKFWLFGIARNVTFVHLRKMGNQNQVDIQDLEHPSYDSQREEQIKDVISVIFNKLRDTEKEALVLIDKEGFSYDEAAEILNITVANLTSRVNRARDEFIKIYESLGVDFTGLLVLPKKPNNGDAA